MNKVKNVLAILFAFVLLPLFIQTVSAAYTSSTNIPNTYQNVGQPAGMLVLPNHHVWYVDGLNKRLVLVNIDTNTILRTVGREGSSDGEFDWGIVEIAADSDGNIYVLSKLCMIYKLDSNGGFITKFDLQSTPNSMCAEPEGFTYDAFTNTLLVSNTIGDTVTRFTLNGQAMGHFGSTGDGSGQFRGPWDLATDSVGRIYVADEWHTGGGRIEIFSSSFAPLSEISSWADIGGTTGFVAVKSVVILSDGTIAATSQNAPRIELFNSSGTHTATVSGGANMYGPSYIVRDNANNIYVNDYMLTGVYRYTEAGSLDAYFPTNPPFVAGKLSSPTDEAFTSHGTILAVDHTAGGVSRVQEFTLAGTYIRTVIAPGTVTDSNHIAYGPDGKLYVQTTCGIDVYNEIGGVWSLDSQIGNGCGTGDGQFDFAGQFAWDAAGNLYVGDVNNHRVQKFTVSTGYDYDSQFGGSELGFVQGVAVAADGTIYVSDFERVHIYNSSGVYTGDFGTRYTEYQMANELFINPLNGDIYLTDAASANVQRYNSSWVLQEVIGTRGGGQMQFSATGSVRISPYTHALAIADQPDGRIVITKTGNRILGLISSADIVRIDNGESLSEKAWDPGLEDLSDIPARMVFGDYVVAEFHVDLSTGDLDWSAVNVLTQPATSKALVVNLNPTDAPGISATHSLYVYRYNNQHNVTVCPDATSFEGVIVGCSSAYTLSPGDPNLSIVTLNGKNYWKIDGLTGTGAFSSLFETSFQLRDLMTRQKISTGSDHNISFGTTYNINHAGDTITVGFGVSWDMTSLVLGDISLLRGSTPLTLAAAPDTDTWGVTWVGNQLVFTAPTNTGSTEGILANNAVTVVLANAHVLNPATVDSYLIDLSLVSDDGMSGQNIETGNINVPIVDDDQVNITGYVNTYIYFDIDTNVTGGECAYNTCPLYTGAGAADVYTVDLGELNAIWVNKSQDAVFTHSDAGTGTINSIYMDLTTNAYNGAVVLVSSANGGLQGPGSNMIAAVTSGDDIVANSGSYGFTMPDLSTAAHGTINRNALCSTATTYCGLTTSQVQVVNTNAAPLDTGHIRMDLGAAASYMNNPGTYTDTLTFVAVGNF